MVHHKVPTAGTLPAIRHRPPTLGGQGARRSPKSPVTVDLTPRSTVTGMTTTTTIVSLAESMGFRAGTLDYYGRPGHLEPPDHSATGHRLDDEASAERLRFIKGIQRMDLRLDDIEELLDVRGGGSLTCGHSNVLVDRRAEVQSEIEQLEAIRSIKYVTLDESGPC